MSEVTRYRFKGAAGEYVYSVDYDAAQSELSALREELTIWKTKACEAAEREAALREELAKLRERHDTVKCQRNDAQQRLTAAEQRNAVLCDLLDEAQVIAGHSFSTAFVAEIDAALAKPTESGASE